MATCDNCGRAVLPVDATTFPNSSVVICDRAECATVARDAKFWYYDHDTDNLRAELGL